MRCDERMAVPDWELCAECIKEIYNKEDKEEQEGDKR